MIVLGFDTATQATAVALQLDDGTTLRGRDNPAPGGHPGHATQLLTMTDELLAHAGIRWSAVQRVAVGVGPGRFTGLRVGIATARGLAQSLSCELVGVSSLHALALPASEQAADHVPLGADPRGTIAVIDARRGEVFAAAFAGGVEIAFPRAMRPAELEAIVEQIERNGGPAAVGWRAVGDGAVLYKDALTAGGVDVPADDSPLHLIDGAAICKLGAQTTTTTAASASGALAAILPDYRRSPDAALARQQPPALGSSRA
ncbi:MAG TPA: tRNA (adenosine(37)-N6)-threonylcarbamoyltransferase complex dimerization subunit type 1 TsaB [Solirubrobacteraceae bacterium]|nr:tRNA (adenosine(37)-N6)-threonylcarbamoyltransferase complex dimerization subunit type 1 TsaB [Solirubrobacteraceae bacterium]